MASALLRTASTALSLHQLDVLERGGVEHDLRPELGEDLAHAFLVLAVGQDGVAEQDVALVAQLAIDLEQVRLAGVQQHERSVGFTRAIWRHSSEPIEPPAPVTSTVRPLR